MAMFPRLTYDNLAAPPDDGKRYELLEGVLFRKPAPTTGHQAIALRLSAWFYSVQLQGYGRAFGAPTDVVLAPDTVVQPDLLFVRRDRRSTITAANIQGPLDVVIEILSPTIRDRDLSAKQQL